MTAMSLSQIAKVSNGQLFGSDCEIAAISTDTRAIEANSLFVALSGEHFDGNDFVAQAFDRGAAAALVTRAPQIERPHVLVEDSRRALACVARANRRAFAGPVVAVTGSSGKTSCKEMLAAILREEGDVLATQGNLNNEIGVPLTLLRLNSKHRFAVIEMGASRRADIQYLCEFAEPEIAVLTNAQPAHIAGFGSLEGVARSKGEIFESLPPDGVAVINADDAHVGLWRQLAAGRRQFLFSLEDSGADFYARDIQQAASATFFTMVTPSAELAIEMKLLGRHMVANALAAAAAALAAGASEQSVVRGLAAVKPIRGRLYPWLLGDITVIDDAYNANPGSARAAIDLLSQTDGRRWLVMGQMAELGDSAADEHRKLGQYAKSRGINKLLACGPWADDIADGFGEEACAFESKNTLLDALREQLQSGDVVLIKGSRSAAMEDVVASLTADNSSLGRNSAC